MLNDPEEVAMGRNLNLTFGRLSALVLCASTAIAQENLISLAPNVRVSAANSNLSHTEMNIAADPLDAKHLVACSIINFERPYKRSTIVYISFDGGKTWTPTLTTKEFVDSGDPYCTIGPTGIVYLAAGARKTPVSHFTKIYRSEDGGKTWSPPAELPLFFDRSSIIANPFDSKRVFINGFASTRDIGSGKSYGGFGLSRSLDGGATFEMPLVRAPIENERHFTSGMGNCVFLSDSTLACALAQSDDDAPIEEQVQSLRLKQKVKVIKVLSAGTALTNAITVASSHIIRRPPGSTSFVPILAVDSSTGAFKDRLYLVWTDATAGRTEIGFSYSADRGQTWSKPKHINDDQMFDVLDPSLGPDDFMPTAAVNQNGVFGVIWYDRRESNDNLGWHVRFRASLDGGETFLPSVRVSEASTVFDEKAKWPIFYWSAVTGGGSWLAGGPLNLSLEIMGQLFNGGDYGGMAADAEGVFHPVWPDNRTGVHQVWTSAITVKGRGILHGSPDLAQLEDVTDKLTLEIIATEYDRSSNQLTFEARLKNTSAQTLTAPLKVKIVSMSSDLAGQVRLSSEQGGVFDMQLSSNALRPTETTLVKKLIFQFADIHPLKRGRDIKLGVIDLDLLILGGKPRTLDNK
jgi:hypothetical protein